MIFNFILAGLAVAGMGRLWAKIQKDFPGLQEWIKRVFSRLLSKAIICNFCFTYWLAFFFVLFFDPLVGWLPATRLVIPEILQLVLSMFISWMALGTLAWIIRFIIEDLQLATHYQRHILKEKSGHE